MAQKTSAFYSIINMVVDELKDTKKSIHFSEMIIFILRYVFYLHIISYDYVLLCGLVFHNPYNICSQTLHISLPYHSGMDPAKFENI